MDVRKKGYRNLSGKQQSTIQIHWQYWAHKTQDEHKQSTTQKSNDEQHGLHQIPGVNTGARDG
jgi:hypothetical protein